MEENNDTDSDFESAEDGSEYFSVTDDREETQFQQLDWDDGGYDYYDERREDTPAEASSGGHPSRLSNHIMLKGRKVLIPILSQCPTNSEHYVESSRIHMRIHPGKKSHNCLICSKSFTHASHLNQHIRTHTGEKPYQCSTCSRSFSQTGHLKQHMSIHTGEKPYQCVICSKSFSNPYNLKTHIRVHTGEKPYQCITCLKSFSLSSHLRAHIRVHTGEKPYHCIICTKSFSQLSTLKRHIVCVHKRNK